ncbi:MAG: hypothetical protein K5885_05495, partial [Bacteroidales bacterium]|nr:hypothetical protein [Bacteroidales bacterium]
RTPPSNQFLIKCCLPSLHVLFAADFSKVSARNQQGDSKGAAREQQGEFKFAHSKNNFCISTFTSSEKRNTPNWTQSILRVHHIVYQSSPTNRSPFAIYEHLNGFGVQRALKLLDGRGSGVDVLIGHKHDGKIITTSKPSIHHS